MYEPDESANRDDRTANHAQTCNNRQPFKSQTSAREPSAAQISVEMHVVDSEATCMPMITQKAPCRVAGRLGCSYPDREYSRSIPVGASVVAVDRLEQRKFAKTPHPTAESQKGTPARVTAVSVPINSSPSLPDGDPTLTGIILAELSATDTSSPNRAATKPRSRPAASYARRHKNTKVRASTRLRIPSGRNRLAD